MKFLSFTLAIICFLLALDWSLRTDFFNPYPAVCRLVSEKIYLPDDDMKGWERLCLRRSRLVKPWSSHARIMKDIAAVLELLKVSHLEIFEPQEARKLWRGTARETGIDSEFVDGELVVFKVHPGSPAAKAGLRYGDVILSLNGEQPNPWQVRSSSGDFFYRRGNEETHLRLQADEFQRDEKVSVRELSPRAYLIRVPSFRKEFFIADPLLGNKKNLQGASRLIIDLRGNQGGNFVAGLHFLADFICAEREVGRLLKPKFRAVTQAEIPDDLDDLKQLKVLDRVRELHLGTHAGNLCLRAPVQVLIDSKTASVAEMVAQALKELRHARILGTPSSGQLLVGVWYPLDELGAGVQISIPEALYESVQGHRIEGQGVQLDQELYYNLSEMQKGEDSWVKRALLLTP